MRKEAKIAEWRKLYAVATDIQRFKPWKLFWDTDLIGIRTGQKPEDSVFFVILGRAGETYGLLAYEGYDAYNGFQMLTIHEHFNLSFEYAMASQRNLACYWGNREELSTRQRKIVRDLGYKYRGQDSWLYFMSHEPGYVPYNLDQSEVLRLTDHLNNLKKALIHYKERSPSIDFEEDNMFSCVYSPETETWHYGEEPLPFTGYHVRSLVVTNEILVQELSRAQKGSFSLEADVRPMGVAITDKKFAKPANPFMHILVESGSGMVLVCEANEPDEDARISLVDSLTDLILERGAPEEIKVSNGIIEATLTQICDICNIRLRRVSRLKGIDEFWRARERLGWV